MTGLPLVSVITIFRDEERFLPEAVESVLAQTYERWELLLCDDGSTDGSEAIARGYIAADPSRIRYLAHPGRAHRGMSATRNLGLAHARGEFVGFLDGDDVYRPTKLARQVELLQQHPEAAMVYGPTCFWHEWPDQPNGLEGESLSRMPGRTERVVAGEEVLRGVLRGRCEPPATCSVLVRRADIEAVGGFEDRFRDLFEDQVFFSKLLLGRRVFLSHECHDQYRQHAGSSSAVAERAGQYHRERSSPTRVAYLEWLSSHLRETGQGESLLNLVRREIWLARWPGLERLRGEARRASTYIRSRGIALAFALGRLILPRRLRVRLWERWSIADRPDREWSGRASDSGSSHG